MSSDLFRKSAFVAALATGALVAGAAVALGAGEFAITARDQVTGGLAAEVMVVKGGEPQSNRFACKDSPDTIYYFPAEGGNTISSWYKKYNIALETVNESGARVPVCEFYFGF